MTNNTLEVTVMPMGAFHQRATAGVQRRRSAFAHGSKALPHLKLSSSTVVWAALGAMLRSMDVSHRLVTAGAQK
jgi:hypothetical protein